MRKLECTDDADEENAIQLRVRPVRHLGAKPALFNRSALQPDESVSRPIGCGVDLTPSIDRNAGIVERSSGLFPAGDDDVVLFVVSLSLTGPVTSRWAFSHERLQSLRARVRTTVTVMKPTRYIAEYGVAQQHHPRGLFWYSVSDFPADARNAESRRREFA